MTHLSPGNSAGKLAWEGWKGEFGGWGKERATESQFAGGISLTSGQAAVGAAQIDAAVWDGCNTKLVVGTGEKGCEGAGKNKVPLTGSASHGNTDLKHEFTASHISLYSVSVTVQAGGKIFMPGISIVLLKIVSATFKIYLPFHHKPFMCIQPDGPTLWLIFYFWIRLSWLLTITCTPDLH